ncbi:MAG: prepilin-type N-terminal cleavage/methylation domain-containing protein [Thermoleophilia bacterium]
MEKVTKIFKPNQGGFTLIELLVVIIIIAILAAVAIPMYLKQREKGWDATVESDLHNAVLSQNTYYVNNSSFTSDIDDLIAIGFELSDDVTVTIVSAVDDTYCMEGFNGRNADRVWWVESGAGSPYPQVGSCP